MRIISGKKIENCFENEFIYKYTFDTVWTNETIERVKMLGHIKIYDSFPRPMFQVKCYDGTTIKGVRGTDECRVVFPRDGPSEAKNNFEKRCEEIF